MPETMPFDPDYYYGLVADNLLKNFGIKALGYADAALNKMKALGDDEGFDIWLEIHSQLTHKTVHEVRPAAATLH